MHHDRKSTVEYSRQRPGCHRTDAGPVAPGGESYAREGGFAAAARELGYQSEAETLASVAMTLGLDTVDISDAKADLKLLEAFPIRLIHRFQVFPLWLEHGSLVLAISDPFDLHAVDAVGSATGMSVVPVVVPSDELAKLIKTHLGVGAETIDGLMAQQSQSGTWKCWRSWSSTIPKTRRWPSRRRSSGW